MNLLTVDTSVKNMTVYLTNPNTSYRIGPANPVKSSKFECVGVIVEVDEQDDIIKVEWRNGSINSYRDNELSLINDTNRYRSIW